MTGRSFNRIQALIFTDRHHDETLGRHAEEKPFRGANSLEGQNQPADHSAFTDEKKLSIAALPQTLPDRLMLQTKQLAAISCWNFPLECWLP